MFGRTERLFSRGQRALARRDFAGAERLLREVLTVAPGYAHVHLYLAHALAEQERLTEAEAELSVAAKMLPAAFVFPLHHGIIALDAGDLPHARAAIVAARRLAPANLLVGGYLELATWMEEGGPPTERLARAVRDLPESFGARALLRLAETTLPTRGGRAAVSLLEPPLEANGLPLSLWLGGLRHQDRFGYAERLLARARFDEAVCYVACQPSLMADSRAPGLLERARRGALRSLDDALVGCAPARRSTLLLHRYEVENELGDQDAVARTLTEWRDAYTAAGAPAKQRPMAAAVIRRLAALEVERGRYELALELCAASRAARPERETAGVEALARLGLGQRRAARHAFEDFLENALFPLDIRLREGVTGSPA